MNLPPGTLSQPGSQRPLIRVRRLWELLSDLRTPAIRRGGVVCVAHPWESRRRRVQGNHPAIVDEDTYNRANGLVTHSGYTHAGETPQTPLKRHVRCSACGCFMTGYEVKKKHLWYYKCNTVGCRCNKSAKTMHKRYYELLSQYRMPQECMEILADMLDAKLKTYFAPRQRRI